MSRFLADADGELHLVFTDRTSDGAEHVRTEFRVIGGDGSPLRTSRVPGGLGQPVEHQWGPVSGEYYVRLGPGLGARTRVHIEDTAIGPDARTPCRRHGHPRRKCILCDELNGETQ
jgi:hypothetical protein